MVSCRDSLHQTQLLVKPGETAGRRCTLWLRKSRWDETEVPIGRSWGIPVSECIICPFSSMAPGSPCLPQSQIRLVVSHVWNVPPCLGWWYSLVNYIDIHVYYGNCVFHDSWGLIWLFSAKGTSSIGGSKTTGAGGGLSFQCGSHPKAGVESIAAGCLMRVKASKKTNMSRDCLFYPQDFLWIIYPRVDCIHFLRSICSRRSPACTLQKYAKICKNQKPPGRWNACDLGHGWTMRSSISTTNCCRPTCFWCPRDNPASVSSDRTE